MKRPPLPMPPGFRTPALIAQEAAWRALVERECECGAPGTEDCIGCEDPPRYLCEACAKTHTHQCAECRTLGWAC